MKMKMTEILLLGTFHFLESDIDFYTEEAQAALEALTGRLAAFSPDCIAVEGAFSQQTAVDESYRRLKLSDFNDYEKMKTETLGSITVFGKRVPISYKNECIQIGYRLGKRLGLEKIHAVDEDAETGGALFTHPSKPVRMDMRIPCPNSFGCSTARNGRGGARTSIWLSTPKPAAADTRAPKPSRGGTKGI